MPGEPFISTQRLVVKRKTRVCMYGTLINFCLVSNKFLACVESSSLILVEACSLTYVLQVHPPLEKVFHLIPENALLSGDDFVPGILEPQPDG